MTSYQKVYMNQIHSSSLLCQLAHMWKSQLLCDAIIRTGQIITKAHRVVLVAACPMLQSMENASAGSHLEVRLAADIKQESVNTFLQYLYEGFMMLTEDNCRDVEKIARLLQVDGVTKCCVDFYKCMQKKTGASVPGSQYKFSVNDSVEFRHVRTTDLQKTVFDRLMKRASDVSRPGSPGTKRQRVQRSGSPDVTIIGSEKADDTTSMAHSYMAPDPWDRVPRLGSGISKSGRLSQPGVIDIVEETLELVQSEPPDNDTGHKLDSRSQQKSVSIAVASQYNTEPEISVVNVPIDRDTSSVSQTTLSNRGSITVDPLSQTPEKSELQHSTGLQSKDIPSSPSAFSISTGERQTFQRQDHATYLSKSDSDMPQIGSRLRKSDPPLGSPRQQTFSQPKPFAIGSASQAGMTSPQASVSSNVPPILTKQPHSHPTLSTSMESSPGYSKPRPVIEMSKEESAPQMETRDMGSIPSSSADLTPDLSIVKVETSEGLGGETGGLDMHVDMPEEGVAMHTGSAVLEDVTGTNEAEIEEWAEGEDISNEGSNISGDQNSSWYMGGATAGGTDGQAGTYKGLSGMRKPGLLNPIKSTVLHHHHSSTMQLMDESENLSDSEDEEAHLDSAVIEMESEDQMVTPVILEVKGGTDVCFEEEELASDPDVVADSASEYTVIESDIEEENDIEDDLENEDLMHAGFQCSHCDFISVTEEEALNHTCDGDQNVLDHHASQPCSTSQDIIHSSKQKKSDCSIDGDEYSDCNVDDIEQETEANLSVDVKSKVKPPEQPTDSTSDNVQQSRKTAIKQKNQKQASKKKVLIKKSMRLMNATSHRKVVINKKRLSENKTNNNKQKNGQKNLLIGEKSTPKQKSAARKKSDTGNSLNKKIPTLSSVFQKLEKHLQVKPGQLTCHICRKSFENFSLIRRHMFCHSERLLFRCVKCQKKFKHHKSLYDHMRTEH